MSQIADGEQKKAEAVAGLFDVEAIIKKKSPRLLKFLPGFIVRYLKRVIHQDDLNGMLRRIGHLHGVDFVDASLADMGISYTVYGIENLNPDGRYIFSSNHPLGGLDGLIFMSEMRKHYPDIRFVVNDLLLNVEQLRELFIPVNKLGGQNTSYAKAIEETYASSSQVLYFPAGLCSRKVKGEILDLEWKKNFIAKAVKHQRDVVPVFFSGRNSNFFYNLANFRKVLGLKANIEMLYLVDEMFKQKGKKLSLIIGKPIPYQTFTKEKSFQQWAHWVRDMVYELGHKLPQ